MLAVRKRKLSLLLFIAFIISIVSALVLYALRQNISLFYTPSQIAAGEAPYHHKIRVGGMVQKGTVIRSGKDLQVQFDVTDFKKSLHVRYIGILPDLFREGQGIVAEGVLLNQTEFQATEVLAKHDENYMPPEVKDALMNKGK
ncbi:cytochrome c maturation protein CcmE [Legionella israelensis]|uniref:Cytochrome c-type biogenesis protein CcmE n=1 Tax=Legionella israelensis TaxID=454 RepID=A0A0W0WHZ1_9GAMM|nr:cytochrome c maturation protein CcmE [Legionella israelensis]KTD31925.1 cytochrome c-type biogenesis protein CcmE [Legionella israelensis]QBR83873.1 cytochrome c maturation protein CcmE [Legionella israelensis]QBS10753.1 cytochrome c maturation protein CcmE [Legionella israelensis]QDP73031.1 cytochrome c maturation protein CcmE [Legionella israelensis]SCY28021.1 cytochrome c-type biogenesis protein CcmE [Legionella israelensis DSM 19235]